MSDGGPFWIAQRHGQDWQDPEVLRAIAWLTAAVDPRAWRRRMDAVRTGFEAGKQQWAAGDSRAPLFDPSDAIAWYVFQANAYAQAREDWFEPEAFRIAPVLKRLGQLTTELDAVTGISERRERLMADGRKQPDDGLFELLVAGAYKRRGWPSVAFVPERRGVAKTQDLLVSAPRRRWAVECKRVNRSGYEADERERGEALAAPVHQLCRTRQRSLVVEAMFTSELSQVSDSYLVERAEAFLRDPRRRQWRDEHGQGQVRAVDWRLARKVLRHDDIFFGSSRMVELLVGAYVPYVDHSVAAIWRPARGRPLHATAVSQASVVSWQSASLEAALRKAKHFRSLVAKASEQLPGDCPGVVHVGYEARDGNSVDQLRHQLNRAEMRSFTAGTTRLRWVYGSYLSPEHTTARNESAALSETTAMYRIGRHQTPEPLAGHLLFTDGSGEPGAHWRKR